MGAAEYVARGDAYRERDNNDSAIAEYNEAIRLDPANAEAYCNRGIAYVNKGRYRLAVANYAKAVWFDPITYWYFPFLVFSIILSVVLIVYSIVSAVIMVKKKKNEISSRQILWGIVKYILWFLSGAVMGIVLGALISQCTDDDNYSIFLLLGALIGALVISVIVHELGHFIAAKSCKMRVYVFAVGLGKTLLKWKRGGVEYHLNAVPIWGYVKMVGGGPNDKDRGAVNEFTAKPVWQRAVVVLAGPVASVIVAFLAIWTLCVWGIDTPVWFDSGLRIGSVCRDSPADSVGFLVGDSIVSINGSPVATWEQLWNQMDTILYRQKHDDYKIAVLRDGQSVVFDLRIKRTGKCISNLPTDGLHPASVPAVVGKVKPKSGADGVLNVGDTILAIKGVPVSHIEEVYDLMYSRRAPKGDSAAVVFDIKRGDEFMQVVVVPKRASKDDYNYYALGIESVPEPMRIKRYGAIEALRPALWNVCEYSVALFDMLNDIFNMFNDSEKGEDRKSAPSMIGDMAWDPRETLYLIGFIGINLAVVSLVIDGGLLICLGMEAIRGKPLSEEVGRDTIW